MGKSATQNVSADVNVNPEHVTTGYVARSLGVSVQTVRRMIERNDLDASWSRDDVTEDVNGRRIRGHRRVTRASLDALLERKRKAGGRRGAPTR